MKISTAYMFLYSFFSFGSRISDLSHQNSVTPMSNAEMLCHPQVCHLNALSPKILVWSHLTTSVHLFWLSNALSPQMHVIVITSWQHQTPYCVVVLTVRCSVTRYESPRVFTVLHILMKPYSTMSQRSVTHVHVTEITSWQHLSPEWTVIWLFDALSLHTNYLAQIFPCDDHLWKPNVESFWQYNTLSLQYLVVLPVQSSVTQSYLCDHILATAPYTLPSSHCDIATLCHPKTASVITCCQHLSSISVTQTQSLDDSPRFYHQLQNDLSVLPLEGLHFRPTDSVTRMSCDPRSQDFRKKSVTLDCH